MAMSKCPECDAPLSTEADTCYRCGIGGEALEASWNAKIFGNMVSCGCALVVGFGLLCVFVGMMAAGTLP